MGGDWKEMFRGVETNDFDLVRYYIANGIDLNYQHPEFLTSALIESIRQNHIEMMQFLLQNGASPTVKEAFSFQSPMDIAKKIRNKEAVEILNQYLNTNEKISDIETKSPTSFLEKIRSYFSLDFN